MVSQIIDLPIGARVSCLDGLCGASEAVIIDPVTLAVTHVVIKLDTFPPRQYLVPLQRVLETTLDHIRLDCPKQALPQLEPFIETEFLSAAAETDQLEPSPAWSFAIPPRMKTPIEHERLSGGELALFRGTLVEATDGSLGQLSAFLLNPGTAQITHLVLFESELAGKRALTLPVSAIEQIVEATIYLKLGKGAIESLPMLPLKRFYHWQDQAVHTLELLVITFETPPQAAQALQTLQRLRREGLLDILNAATLLKDESGKITLKEKEDVTVSSGALFGAITGGLLGLIAGPLGAVVGAVAGAAAAGVAAYWLDMGFSDESLEALPQALRPGGSALVLLVEQRWLEKVLSALAEFKGQRLQQTLTDEMVQRLLARAEPKPTQNPGL
jgi:uncharacterized membrane protein